MIIHNLNGRFDHSDRGKQINIKPDSGGPKVKTLRLAIARELNGVDEDNNKKFRAHIGKLKSGLLMAFPEKKEDDRHFIIGGFAHWKHRTGVGIDVEHTTAEIVEEAHGYGAWGSGVALFAILSKDQVIVSTQHGDRREVIYIDENGDAVKQQMDTAEFAQFTDLEVEVYL